MKLDHKPLALIVLDEWKYSGQPLSNTCFHSEKYCQGGLMRVLPMSVYRETWQVTSHDIP